MIPSLIKKLLVVGVVAAIIAGVVIDAQLTGKLLAIGVLFVGVLRIGVFAWAKLGNYSNAILGIIALASMYWIHPWINMESVFDSYVLPSFIVLHICGGTLVCSVIAKWVEDKARRDIERESAAQKGE